MVYAAAAERKTPLLSSGPRQAPAHSEHPPQQRACEFRGAALRIEIDRLGHHLRQPLQMLPAIDVVERRERIV